MGFMVLSGIKALLVLMGAVSCLDGANKQITVAGNQSNGIGNVMTSRPCPCVDVSHCQRISTIPQHEVFVFSVNNKNWKNYDWAKVTTVTEFGYHDDNLLCYAHSRGAKVVQNANYPVDQLTNVTARHEWVNKIVAQMNDNFLDGVNVDFESEIDVDSVSKRAGLTALIKELTSTARQSWKHAQISFDVAWSPDCIDKRCYDYKIISEIVDFVFVMSYDERSQIRGSCIAWANSAYNNTDYGLKRYLDLKIPPSKLVLGIPWYGYRYTCAVYSKVSHKCCIDHVPFRGVNCSDAAGREHDYSSIMRDLPSSETGRLWDKVAKSPYFTLITGAKVVQIWYDDPQSLGLKCQRAVDLGLRGVGMWNADSLDYTNVTEARAVWDVLPYYK